MAALQCVHNFRILHVHMHVCQWCISVMWLARIYATHCDTCVRVHVGRIRYITACIHTQLHVQSLYCMQSHTHAFSDSIATALPQFIAWWFDLLQGDTCHGKNIFQHVWLSQYWNCMAGCNVELLWNMWYKTDQRISQFPACWFVFFCIVTHVMKTHILTYMIITILSMYGVMSLSNLNNKTCIHVMTRALGSGRNIAFLCDTKNTIIALESGMNIAFLCDKKNMSIALGSGGTLHSWTIRKHEHCTRIWEEHWNQSTKNYDCTGFRGARRFPLSCISVCIYALHDVCLHIYIMQLQYGITLQTQARGFTRPHTRNLFNCFNWFHHA